MAAISRKSTRIVRVLPETLDLVLLQDAQQLRLQLERHVADLVEEQRALVRELEPSDLLRQRAREGAFLMTEPFALEQSGRRRRAVHRHQRAVAPVARRVQRPREQFLAGARLAEQQHRRVRRGDGADLVQDALQRLALADDLLELVGAADFFLQIDVFARELLLQRGNLVERHGILERDRDLRGDLGDAVQLVRS